MLRSVIFISLIVSSANAVRFGVHHELGGVMHPNPVVLAPKTGPNHVLSCHDQFKSLCPAPETILKSWKCLRSSLDAQTFTPQCNHEVERSSPCLNDAIALCPAAKDPRDAARCLYQKRSSTSERCQEYLHRSPFHMCEKSIEKLCPQAKHVFEGAQCIRLNFPDADKECKQSIRQWRNVHMRLSSGVERNANANRVAMKNGVPLSCKRACDSRGMTSSSVCLRDNFDRLPRTCILDLGASVRGQCILFLQRTCAASLSAKQGVSTCLNDNWTMAPRLCQEAIRHQHIVVYDSGIVAQRIASASNINTNATNTSGLSDESKLKLILIVTVCATGLIVLLCILKSLLKGRDDDDNIEAQASYSLVRSSMSM